MPAPKTFYSKEGMKDWARGFGPSDEEKERERKTLEKAYNEMLEAEATKGICRKCQSNVCRCKKEEE